MNTVGDQIQIGNWVDADQSTGKIIHVPNGKVFLEFQANYSKGFNYIWNEIPVLGTFKSDWKKAKEILATIVSKRADSINEVVEKQIKEVSKIFMFFYKHLTPIVYIDVKESGVLLTVRYLCDPLQRRSTQHDIWENILDEFGKRPKIDLAYPTKCFYNYKVEKAAPKDNV